MSCQSCPQNGGLCARCGGCIEAWQRIAPTTQLYVRPQMSDNGFPRRNRMDLWTPAERAIYDAMQLVEQMGASVRLTDAVILLGYARDAVADHVEGITRE